MATSRPRTATIPVTVDNFIRAESDMYFSRVVDEGGFGRFSHRRELVAIDNQPVVRANRDTLYSSAVFDLDAAPVTVTLPDAGSRFCSMMVIDEDHYVRRVTYDPGPCFLTRENIGTRFVFVAVRTLVDPLDPEDLKKVHAIQNSIQVSQENAGSFEVPNWDATTQKRVREALFVLGSTLPDFRDAFGTKGQVDPVRRLIGSAMGWGGNPDKEAVYLNVTPERNDGVTVYQLTVRDVPVDGFWSVSVYNAKGMFEPNPLHAYTINNLTAKRTSEGSVYIQFGGCEGENTNSLPIVKGWNYTVRLYRPRAQILTGKWNFPEPQPLDTEVRKAA